MLVQFLHTLLFSKLFLVEPRQNGSTRSGTKLVCHGLEGVGTDEKQSNFKILVQAKTYLHPFLLFSLSLSRPTFLVQRSLVFLCLRDALGVASIGVSVKLQATIYAGKYLAVGAHMLIMFLHLVLLQRSATRITSKEHHSYTPRHVHVYKSMCLIPNSTRA